MKSFPRFGRNSPVNTFKSVDFPHPLGPSNIQSCPSGICSEHPFSTTMSSPLSPFTVSPKSRALIATGDDDGAVSVSFFSACARGLSATERDTTSSHPLLRFVSMVCENTLKFDSSGNGKVTEAGELVEEERHLREIPELPLWNFVDAGWTNEAQDCVIFEGGPDPP